MEHRNDLFGSVVEQLRILIVAGIGVGATVAGGGGRLAMYALRVTSPDSVIGRRSDDGFRIGAVTTGGTYQLLVLGSVVGVIGAATYQCVAPRLIGPVWFRRLTVALAAGAVVGSMLVHSDGIDFVLLQPVWLAVVLFVLLPAVFAVAVGIAVDRVSAPASATAAGRPRWMLPLALVIAFPPVVVPLAVATITFTLWVLVRDRPPIGDLRRDRVGTFVIRALWLGVAMLGALALVEDVNALA